MFNGGNNFPSLSDIAAVTNNEGFGGNNAWWVLIILFFLCGGWGRNGYAMGESYGYAPTYVQGNSGAIDNYVLTTDFAMIERKLDTVNSGLCDGFYAMNTGMLNGFAGVNSAIAADGYATAQLANNINTNMMQSTNQIQSGLVSIGNQIQQCCCDNKAAIADLKYTMATDTCAVTTAINNATTAIIQNNDANFRQLHDENVAMQMAAKDETIASLRSQLDRCAYRNDNAEQSQYIINTLRPPVVPAYTVPNPNACDCCNRG